jgi:hypothetical protein
VVQVLHNTQELVVVVQGQSVQQARALLLEVMVELVLLHQSQVLQSPEAVVELAVSM